MTNKLYTITKKDLYDLFGRLAATHRVVVPYVTADKFSFDDFDPEREGSIELGGIRQSQPLKSFLSMAREKAINGQGADTRPLVIAGVKGCDLSSLKLQDFVFLGGDVKDPLYAGRRARAMLIGTDCTFAKETCFCLAMDGAPFPRADFDMNLSYINDYFLVEIGSDRAKSLLSDFVTFFKAAASRDIDQRRQNREKVASQIEDFIAKRQTPGTARIRGAVKKNYDNTQAWQDFASTCVECGACNLVCPTCHCFLLFDDRSKEFAKRYRAWDACLYKSFARVAGGANPRKHLYERLRNRFDKKFEFFPQVMDYFACTGCGRCIEACPGDIDIREVLKGVVTGSWKKPPHE